MKRSRLATYAMGIAIATTMVGCGGDDGGDGGDDGGDGGDASAFADESAADIAAAAKEAMGEVEALHIEGDITTGDSTVEMDLSLSNSGSCEGTVSIDGGGLEVLQADGGAWFKADDAFWEAQAPDQAAQIIELTAGKWVVDDTKQYTSFCDLEGFLGEIVSDDDDEDAFEKGDTEDVDGQETVKLTGDESTAYIATDEPHYILKLEGSGEDDEGSVTFSEFGEEIEVEAPAEDEIIDLSQAG